MHPSRHLLVVFAFCLSLQPPAHATLYWDSNGSASGAGMTPTGTWGSSAFWSSNSAGTGSTTTWTSGDTAVFAAGSDSKTYTVTVNGSQTAAGITVEEGTPTLSGGSISLIGGSTIDVKNSRTLTVSSPISGGTVSKIGSGTLALGAANQFTGLDFSAGRIDFNDNSAAGTGTINVASTAGSFVTSAGDVVLSNMVSLASGAMPLIYSTSNCSLRLNGIISGSGGLQRDNTGAGTLTLAGANTFTGGFTISQRDVSIAHSKAFGTGTLTLGDNIGVVTAITVNATTALTGANAVTNPLTVLQDFWLSGESLELTSSFTITAPTRTIGFNFASGKIGILSGNISGSGALTTNGIGTLKLAGASTYTGATTVSGGTAQITGSLSGTSGVSVSGTLSGSGHITPATGGSVTFQTNGKLSPGVGVGALTIHLSGGSVDLTAGILSFNAGLLFDLAAPASSDQLITLGGAVNIGNGILNFNEFTFTLQSGFGPGDFILLDGDTQIIGSLGSNVDGVLNGYNATLALSDDQKDLVLHVVPEPGSALLLLVGVGALVGRNRRVSLTARQ